MSFKNSFHLLSSGAIFWWSNPFCTFGLKHNEKHFCEIILNLEQLGRICHLKICLIYSSGGHLFHGAGPFVQFW